MRSGTKPVRTEKQCRNKVGGEWTGQVNDWPRGRGGEEPRVT